MKYKYFAGRPGLLPELFPAAAFLRLGKVLFCILQKKNPSDKAYWEIGFPEEEICGNIAKMHKNIAKIKNIFRKNYQ